MNNDEFFPNFKGVKKLWLSLKLPINEPDKTQLNNLEAYLNKWMLGLGVCWGSLLALDIKHFYLKQNRMMLKVLRSKYHLFTGLICFTIYTQIDCLTGWKALNIVSQYDKRLLTLKIFNDVL